VCRQLVFVLFCVKEGGVPVSLVDSHMVKMSRRDRHSAIQEIRSWSTEQLQKFLTDVSFSSHTLIVPRRSSVLQLTERVCVFVNAMAWRVQTAILRFAI
jgi:hypothetical protein